jgi:hypothetical protein
MILINGFASVIESIYSKEELTESKSEATHIVNPTEDTYYGKTIIVTNYTVDLELLSSLSKNNLIISRVRLPKNLNYTLRTYRSDRIRNLNILVEGVSEAQVTRDSTENIVIFTRGNNRFKKLVTRFPVNITMDFIGGVTDYDVYLSLINNYVRNEIYSQD